MKNRFSKGNPKDDGSIIDKRKTTMKNRNKNMTRMGGGGLSLEAFANAKSRTNDYNPAIIKSKREFYKNAKYVKKYKKSLKEHNPQNDHSPVPRGPRQQEDDNEGRSHGKVNQKFKKNKKAVSARNLEEVYEKKREEEEKARMEREAIARVKKEEREKALHRRKALREKMLKKTRSGQPVMKYRIEHLLETIKGSTSS